MSWIGLRHKKAGPLYPSEWNLVVDALDILYYNTRQAITRIDLRSLDTDIIPSEPNKYNLGQDTKEFKAIHAFYGYFETNVFIAGKPVIKDGDPVAISEFQTTAQDQLRTQIINALKQSIETLLDKSGIVVNAGSYYETDPIDCRLASLITIIILCDYDMYMTIKYSKDGTNFYDLDGYEDITITANKVKTLVIEGCLDYIRIKVSNPDTANAHNLVFLKVKGKP